MRVIGGNLRGKKILNPTDKSTRPLKDMVRESIFNIGSLIPHGGQNPLESAREGNYILHGPHIENFKEVYEKKWLEMMKNKLGIFEEEDKDISLIQNLLSWMKVHKE